MSYMENLSLFLILLFGIIIVPGMDMVFVLASSLTGGRPSGLAATAGIVAGGVVHTLYAALGVGVLLHFAPSLFNTLLLAGALYIAWIGIQLVRSSITIGGVGTLDEVPLWVSFRRGAMTCLLNPKAYLFMLAVFPQFLRPEFGPMGRQAFVLGLIIALTQVGVYGLLALGAGGARGWLSARPGAGLAVNRGVGALLVAVAVVTCIGGLRGL